MRAWLLTAAVAAAALIAAPAALADNSYSSNWAGYAVHRTGVSFRKVSASWTQPKASCTPGQPAFSAYWVGLGGYSATSQALEQIGTESDCDVSGNALYSMWYELVPAPSTSIRLSVGAGDRIDASVSVLGRRATVSLDDVTRHHGFTKTLQASVVDVSSAEWIVEAPSECTSINACQTLPLANFGTAAFSGAKAVGIMGHSGSISSPRWSSTKITLTPGGRRFAANQGFNTAGATATPSLLAAGGSAFAVRFSQGSASSPFMTPRMLAAARAGRLYH